MNPELRTTGDRADTLSALLEDLGPRLRWILGRFGIPQADAEDLLQEVCLQFLRKEHHVVDRRAWLVGALKKECLCYWRRHRRQLYVAVDRGILELTADPGLDAIERNLLQRDLRVALSSLRGRCRSILALRYAHGADRRTVAERVGCAKDSVDKLTRRCLDALGRTLYLPFRRAQRG